jgi:hypothetical protein
MVYLSYGLSFLRSQCKLSYFSCMCVLKSLNSSYILPTNNKISNDHGLCVNKQRQQVTRTKWARVLWALCSTLLTRLPGFRKPTTHFMKCCSNHWPPSQS